MEKIVLGLGMVLVIEGLVFALAPSRLEEALELLRRIPAETRRLIGLAAITLGTGLVWLAQSLWG
ncbi:DUF2065 domain-containing protein [Rhodovulum sulfidophilum]|uniref:DUF2065 domain-containing protein n=1 Tax=Rhodovulum sulfidophilum TaxID=35806 RepID=UPI0005AA6372|nr:DUF2065 domain-containing protein [Rhodovulum sulfidophilum]ANB35710.1 hypothetical protein A6W98_17565 [Rhodovulum sulfidophilum DSM 1374]ANB39532.1 hypothetical protein A6024_17420 [Rhodovulum sulfidophilum]MBL3587118.1 DUF2065 domain-containing protein [Rhodovulum sulfidophilum]MBL3597142.1 DUF2065 domain-containing protein [Rhodovulum sulfidophilum]MCE8417582.1 DUF2065 domain-containing protein [Rhodovulum sulfidophilum]